jgi:hypothetical protein
VAVLPIPDGVERRMLYDINLRQDIKNLNGGNHASNDDVAAL